MFAEQLAEAGSRLLNTVLEAARLQLDKPAERSVAQQRRDTLQALMTHGEEWIDRLGELLRDAGVSDRTTTVTGALVASMQGHTQKLMLVDDETVQKEIFVSRLSQAIVDLAVWELNDLGTRIAALEGLDEMADHDLFRPQQLAKIIVRSFIDSDFGPDAWAGVEGTLKVEIGALATEAYHEAEPVPDREGRAARGQLAHADSPQRRSRPGGGLAADGAGRVQEHQRRWHQHRQRRHVRADGLRWHGLRRWQRWPGRR